LLPALILVVAAHLILQLTILGEPGRWWARTWPVLGYVANYSVIADVDMVHMAHTWSLAIEEHFYLLWPATLMLIPARWRFRVTGGLAVGFMLWRLALLAAGSSNVRIFFATDTNAFAPLLGCAVAIAFHEKRIPAPARNVSALATTTLIIAACLPFDFTDRRMLWAAMPVAIVAAIAIHAALFQPASWLENRILRWFGKISYGLYLWHFMLISLPWERQPLPPLLMMVVAPIVAAWLSWRYIEAPFLNRNSRAREVGRPTISTDPFPALPRKDVQAQPANMPVD
jgi:peptidoglycan/LPS O-acetylase OafA/YrhL